MLLFTALLAASPAAGYELNGHVWDWDEPVEWAIVADADGHAERFEQELLDTWALWEEADECLALRGRYLGIRDDLAPLADDGVSTVSFHFPADWEDTDRYWGYTLVDVGDEPAFERDGELLYYMDEYDTVMNLEVWSDPISSDELDEDCSGSWVVGAVFGRQMGFLRGLTVTCTGDQDCTQAEAEAAMYWDLWLCNLHGMVPQADDIAGLTTLYGTRPIIEEDQDEPGIGVVPSERCFTGWAPVPSMTWVWDFGDGATAEGPQACHTWTAPGRYTVTLAVGPGEDGCAEDSLDVTVCEALLGRTAPAFSVVVIGLELVVTNEITFVDQACTDQIRWELWGNGELLEASRTWEPDFDVPSPGPYAVKLTISGIAGDLEEVQGVIVPEDCGCGSVGGGTRGLLSLATVLGLARRRRGGTR